MSDVMRLSGEAVFVACDTTGTVRGIFSSQQHAELYLRSCLSDQISGMGKGTIRIWIIDEPEALQGD